MPSAATAAAPIVDGRFDVGGYKLYLFCHGTGSGHDIFFPTVSAFHEWSWSTGWRRAWQAVPDAHLDEAKAAIDAYLEASASGHGSIRLTTGVRYTRATGAA